MKHKRILFAAAFVLVALFLVTVPGFATDVIIPENDSIVFSDIMPLAVVNNYTVVPFAEYSSGSYTYYVSYNGAVSSGSSYVFYGQSSAYYPVVGGYTVTIPASNIGGYLYVYGIFPAMAVSGSGSLSWVTLTGNTVMILPSYYIVSSSSAPSLLSYSPKDTDLHFDIFDGSVYIPPHSMTLYLNVFSWISYPNVNTGLGASFANPSVLFVPDTQPVNYTSQLNSLITNTSNTVSSLSSINTNINASNSYLNSTLQKLTSIENQIANLASSVGGPSAMEQFEADYLEKNKDQLQKVEDFMSPSNTALPNGGDFAGFVSDVQGGLGLNGSSFNPSEFASATSKFGSANANGVGGPWEFFSQAVLDSLSGDTSSVGLSDDDFIYAWLDETQRRWKLWN